MGKKKPKRASKKAKGPAKARRKGQSSVNSNWSEAVKDFLGEVQTGASISLSNDRSLLHLNKTHPERKSAAPSDADSTNTEDLGQVKLSEKHYLSVEPEIFKVLYQRHVDSLKSKLGVDLDRTPLHNIQDIFDDIAQKAEQLGFNDVLSHLGSRKLRVVTVCSGTESPLLALKMFSNSFQRLFGKTFDIEHLFSAEIVPFKQAYIERNFHPPIIFRDVKELEHSTATTAYGAIREVPVGADILVAGFSCVDYSNLNKKRKKAGEVGESRDTFYATLNYAKKCRPPIIVLENVSNAPWPSIIRDWEKVGYSATQVKVDTKSYYLPQTRERGYMLCLDTNLIDGSTPDNDPHLTWNSLMGQFKRPASSPVDKFLLHDDDPRVQEIRREMASRNSRDGQVHDWSSYKTRHQAYRMQEQLGNKRPLTRWQDNGSCKMPDFAWKDWSKAQPERVWDTLDMNFLRSIYRGYDLSYKLRVLELSQGIDREIDKRAFGIVGCITPSGIPYVTTRGGPLLGIEALAVQGIPINDLILTCETQRELQDLAGNAMSTTPVGVAIISALLVGFRTLSAGPIGSIKSPREETDFQVMSLNDRHMTQHLVDLSNFGQKPVSEILDAALKGSRLCICEGRASLARKDIKLCAKCGHTACIDCAGNPPHDYNNISALEAKARKFPTEVEDELKDCLPMTFVLQGISIEAFNAFTQSSHVPCGSIWDIFLEVVRPALGEVLNFQDITRGKTWIARYEGAHSTVTLTLSGCVATWSLYVKAPLAEPGNSILRQMLSLPVARMSPNDKSIFTGQWRIIAPLSSHMGLSISGEGTKYESWVSKVGLQHEGYLGSKVWTQLRISASEEDIAELGHDIRGVYDLLPDCGSANGSLHRKAGSEISPPIYLFLDPAKLGLPELDSFVFSLEHDRLDSTQSRMTIAEMSPLWRPSRVYKDPTFVQCFYRKQAVCATASIEKLSSGAEAQFWTPSSDFVLDLGGAACHEAHITLLSSSISAAGSDLPWKMGNWTMTNLIESPSMLQSFAWLIQRFRSFASFGEWREPKFQPSNLDTCTTCSPIRPSIRWVRNNRNMVKPYEDPVEAGAYERQLKARPPTFVAFTRIDEHGVGHIQICVNITSLVHQASAKLNMGSQISLHWRVTVEDASTQDVALPGFKVKNNRDNAEHAQPPGFKRFRLRPEQLRSLNWMVEQEKDDSAPFVEEEVEEAVLAPLNWRAEGRATGSKVVHGGILSDDVGYGKTATVLGLIDVQFSQGRQHVPEFVDGLIPLKATLIVVPDVLVRQWETEITKFLGKRYKVLVLSQMQCLGRITIRDVQSADIILATWAILQGKAYYEKLEQLTVSPRFPTNTGRVFSNWFSEALDKLADRVNTLRSDGPKALLESIRHKRVEMEANATYSMFTPSKRLRGNAYVEAQEQKEAEAANIADDPQGSCKRKREDEVDVNSGMDDDNRGDGGDNAAAKATKKKDDYTVFKLSESPEEQDWRAMKTPFLHMFEFNRIIVDEFTYAGNKSYVSLVALKSRTKWILSGTPPLNNFADVKTISPFLGINLGVDDEGSGKSENTRLKELQQGRSDAEQFHSFKASHSAAWHRRRHDIAQKFLDQFMRQNSPEIDEIPWTEHICPVVLTSAERAIYIELYIQLMSQNLNPRKGIQGGVDNDQTKRLNDLIKGSKTPREALQKRCSTFDPGNMSNDSDASVSCSSIIDIRGEQIEELGSDLEMKFKLALWLERNLKGSCPQFDNLRSLLTNHSLGDETVAKKLQCHLINATRTPTPDDGTEFYRLPEDKEVNNNQRKKPKKGKGKKKPKKTDVEEEEMEDRWVVPATKEEFIEDLRAVSSNLRKLFDEAISRERALRLLKAIRSFQELKPEDPGLRNCSKCGYQPPADGNMFILGQCGHVACKACVANAEASEQCIVEFCQGSAQAYHILKTEDLGRDATPTKSTPYGGKKFEELVKLLKDTTRIGNDEQVILFVQFEQLMNAAKVALEVGGIKHSAISGTGIGGGNIVEEFKKETKKGKTQRPKVLILNLGGETAAGLNLQNANHVIFLSPVLTDTQYDYDSTMVQTIGRCRRFGQKKRVHIYHFVALESIDVNVLQHRRRQVLIERNGEFLLVPEEQIMETDKANWRGFSLDGVHASGHLDE